MGDAEIADQTLAAETPAEAQALGRKVRNFEQSKWDESVDRVVEQGNYLKFRQNKLLGQMLLATEERMIVETSPNDGLWGVGFNSEHALAHVDEWGQNKLGQALMRVRDRLKQPLQLN